MSAPRKNTNYFSPYSQHVGQYPSQTSDYRTQHTGGLQQPHEREQQNRPQGTPHFYQSRTPQQQQQQCGFYEDRQSSPHFYRNKTPYQQQGRNFGQRGGRRGFHQQHHQQRKFNNGRSTSTDTFSQYFHSSMLEDPWHDLMERHNAIHGSVINEASKTKETVDT
ncbi:hypothetical protein KR215_008242 [Drosophila sulfurigaster]|nr:hypothetical protein KR215_008242 [Drosophila sulfurigaster]